MTARDNTYRAEPYARIAVYEKMLPRLQLETQERPTRPQRHPPKGKGQVTLNTDHLM
jgi:hypothetical protein